jgi:hypothetical protein
MDQYDQTAGEGAEGEEAGAKSSDDDDRSILGRDY